MLTEVNNSEFTMKNQNLKSWKPGVSGNPKGRPKGSRNIKKVIQDLLSDPRSATKLHLKLPRDTETPLEAIAQAMMIKAIGGDVRAADTLLKYAIDREDPANELGGFFSNEPSQLTIKVVDALGNPMDNNITEITHEGQLPGYEDEEPKVADNIPVEGRVSY